LFWQVCLPWQVQSFAQVVQPSPLPSSHVPLPQVSDGGRHWPVLWLQTLLPWQVQSCGHEAQVSPCALLHVPSPQGVCSLQVAVAKSQVS
jgi:hypothetical protein